MYRAVPVPEDFLRILDLVHGIRDAHGHRNRGRRLRLWPWSRMPAWCRIGEVMREAGVRGAHATPKGLRHGIGVAAVTAGIPLDLV